MKTVTTPKTPRVQLRWALNSPKNDVMLYRIVGSVRDGDWFEMPDVRVSQRRAAQMTKRLADDLAIYKRRAAK